MNFSDKFNLIQEKHKNHLFETSPVFATMMGDMQYNHLLGETGPEALKKELAFCSELLEDLKEIPREELKPDEQLTYDIFVLNQENSLKGAELGTQYLCADHFHGVQISLPQIAGFHPLNSPEDYKTYLSRVSQMPRYLEQTVETLKEGMKKGIVHPDFSIEQTIGQINDIINNGGSAFIDRLPMNSKKKEEKEIVKEIMTCVKENLLPAFQNYADFLQKKYLPKASKESGLSALPNGKELYKYLAGYHTSKEMTPEDIHETGVKELKKIVKEMETIQKQTGFGGNQKEFFEYLRTDAKFLPKSREEYLKLFETILAAMEQQIPKYFESIPRTPYEVKPMEPFREKNAPTALYMPGSMDGERPGTFYVNTSEWEQRSTYTLEALSYHEAVPGHHFQISLAMEQESLPFIRKISRHTAYIEGWALYVEKLAKDMGFYKDPYADYGRLTFDAWRTARLVIDTGIHYMGWSREKAIDFLKDFTSLCEPDIIAEVDRYCVYPGQALSYKTGQLVILELRKKAWAELGDDFSYKKFHDAILLDGALPLDVFKTKMEKWIESQKVPVLNNNFLSKTF